MVKIIVCLLLSIFLGCGKTGDINNDLNTILLKPSSNIIELFKKLREYELIVEDHIKYKYYSKSKINEESIEKKIRDINYVKSLSDRYDKWYLVWNNLMESSGKELNNHELKLLKNSVDMVFEKQIKLNKLSSVSTHSLFDYPRDSIYFYQYRNIVDNQEF